MCEASGRACRDYACGLKMGDAIPTCANLSNLFGCFKAMRTCHSRLRYLDWDGQVHLAKGKTGGQQGDPLEMFLFNLTILNLWGRVIARALHFARTGDVFCVFLDVSGLRISDRPGRVLAKCKARAIAHADDAYIKGRLSVALQVLAELKRALKEDAGLERNVSKTCILPKGTTQPAGAQLPCCQPCIDSA